MNLATSIRIEDGDVVATAIDGQGSTLALSPEELAIHGLPTGKEESYLVRTDLSTWLPASFDEYAFAALRPAIAAQHQAWSFVHGRRRYVVPALALIRSLVKTEAGLFPKLFQPQSLDDICSPTSGPNGATVVVHARLRSSQQRTQNSVVVPLSWLYSFPSARQAWSSVYQNAKQGRIGLSLPSAILTFNVHSMRQAGSANVYVTRLSLQAIEPQEEPLPFARGHERRLRVSGHSEEPRLSPASGPSAAVESLRPQRYEVADDVWDAVEPILRGGRGRKTDNRRKLNTILQVTQTETTWEMAAVMHHLPKTNASTALNRWQRDGRWDRVMETLTRLGESPMAPETVVRCT